MPRLPEVAGHRNLRRRRSEARGVVAAAKLGCEIPVAAFDRASDYLSGHHQHNAAAEMQWQGKGGSMQLHAEINRLQAIANQASCSPCGLGAPAPYPNGYGNMMMNIGGGRGNGQSQPVGG